MAESLAVGAAEQDDLQVALFPFGFGENFLEIFFCLFDGAAVGKSPAFGETVNVCVDREGRNLEGVNHHDACRLVAHTGECFEFFEGMRDFAVVFFDENFRQIENVLAFG